ncbi:hypothetical protein N7509_004272 [Penicillium cosmopolitanum]|uniref:F-box domain-containing protein n=1 Tax=Penicillium cosmopolitanum TaxID=1131564 RepID=A0A9W9W6P4_9EURO|nr:uncharacterized protein N7509_004272 [Penicillium cosmopolitanum]KAJ5404401.1 hypothetical protein N7509_004272 [Penicillium cosmopolitanum]
MSLSRLPDEIILTIADHVSSLKNINALAQTNRRCYKTLTRHLYLSSATEDSILRWAAERGRTGTVQILFDLGAFDGLHTVTTRLQEPLKIAARNGHPETITCLGKHADRFCENMQPYYQNAFGEAIEAGQIDSVKVLINHGADVNGVCADGDKAIHSAALSNGGEIIKFLVINCGVNIYNLDQHGTSALHIASAYGKLRAVNALLDCGFDPNFIDDHGDAPIHILNRSRRGPGRSFSILPKDYENVTGTLLKRGADPYRRDRYGFMPLWIAASLGRDIDVELLLKHGVDPNGLDANGNSPKPIPLEEFQEMIKESRHHDRRDPPDGFTHRVCCTPLCIAAFLGAIEVLHLLLKHGANPSFMDPCGDLPLHLAVMRKSECMVRMLITRGASVHTRDRHGWAPLQWALKFGGHDVVELLLNEGASIDCIDSNGIDPIFRVLEYGHETRNLPLLPPQIVNTGDWLITLSQGRWPHGGCTCCYGGEREPHTCQRVVGWFLERGSRVDSKDALGRTMLHQAAFQNCKGTVRLLLEKGADPMSKDQFGQIPLHMACSSSFYHARDVFKMLLDAGSDPNLKDNNGYTTLHMAAMSLYATGIRLLRLSGLADFTATDNNGNTPLHLAVDVEIGMTDQETIMEVRKADLDLSLRNNDGHTAWDLATKETDQDEHQELFVDALTCELPEDESESESSESDD